MELLELSQFRNLILAKTPIVDVRAAVEFAQGRLPNSVNLPLLNDDERKEIGTLYKQNGQAAAVQRGYELISGELKKSRVQAWADFVQKNPEAVLTCFRGGLRSKISQEWLAEMGHSRPRIAGGFKAFRQFLMTETERNSKQKLCVVSGATGSGKTLIIQQISLLRATVDLEKLAHHRGSAFGAHVEPQPSQIDFENRLAAELMQIENHFGLHKPLVVEDESRLIGRCAQPEIFFNRLRESKIVMVDESMESRVQVTFDDYIVHSPLNFSRFEKSLGAIAKKLGGIRYQELCQDLEKSKRQFQESREIESNKIWIEKLLVWYYDPLYLGSLQKRQPQIQFQGSRTQVLDFLKS